MSTSPATILLLLMDQRGIGPKGAIRLYNKFGTKIAGLELIEMLSRELSIGIAELAENHARIVDEISELEKQGVRAITCVDAEYPRRLASRLGDDSPPVLFARGNRDLLKLPSVGFCGSRKASQKGLAVTADCSAQLARHGVVVISGYAAGVDSAAHKSALEEGGATIVVLPEGIAHFRVRRELHPWWDWERVLVLSQFVPAAGWAVGRAMQRNDVIAGLSSAMIVIEAGATGGTVAAGRRSKELEVPLFAVLYGDVEERAPGNKIILDLGAVPLSKSGKTNLANLSRVLKVCEGSEDSRMLF